MDNSEEPKLNIKLTNHLTGEITEVEINSANKAKDLYLELAASSTVIERAKKQLKNYLGNWLGDDESQPFADGHIVKWTQRTQLVYRPEDVKEALQKNLDKDAFAAAWEVITEINQPAANELIKEMMERGELPPDTLKEIRSTANTKSTVPYIEVK